MRSIAISALLLCAAMLHAADWTPAKAEVTMKKGGEPQMLYVSEVTVDKLMAGRDQGGTAQAAMNFRDVANIEWIELRENIDYAKGLGDLSSEKYERALKNFERAAKLKKQVLQIKAGEGMAEAHVGLQQFAEAVAALDAVISAHPKWPWLPEIIYRKGEIQMAAGDVAAADATFASLADLKSTFGASVVSSSLLGRSEVKVASKDNAGAAALLAEAFGQTSAEEDPGLRGRIGLKLAEQQQAAGKQAEAEATLDQVKFLPLPPDDLSRVHRQLAEVLLAKGELKAAFDFAVFGALVDGAADSVTSDARAVARRIRTAIDKDDSFSNEAKLAYRQAYDKL